MGNLNFILRPVIQFLVRTLFIVIVVCLHFIASVLHRKNVPLDDAISNEPELYFDGIVEYIS